MNVREIVKAYLIENGFDGLYNPDNQDGCGCKINDLFPCEEIQDECCAGYLVKCYDGKLDCIGNETGEF